MVYSMTGFGGALGRYNATVVSVEIRGVNARQPDVRFKLPAIYRELEPGLRATLQTAVLRGKVEVTIERKDAQGGSLDEGINEPLFRRYYDQLIALNPGSERAPATLTAAVLRLPNVVGLVESALEGGEVEVVEASFAEAITDFLAFREAEGGAIAEALRGHATTIQEALPGVVAHEAEREVRMRQRLERLVEDKLHGTAVDRQRLEQEVVYFLDKMDIAEEKARLAQHCTFFLEKLDDGGEVEKGRRLNFIAQEIGREINTLGAKAYSSDMQRVVVHLKDELEKIKEQLANVV